MLTIPLSLYTGEEVHTTEAQSMGRDQGYVHLQKTEKAWLRDHTERLYVAVAYGFISLIREWI